MLNLGCLAPVDLGQPIYTGSRCQASQNCPKNDNFVRFYKIVFMTLLTWNFFSDHSWDLLSVMKYIPVSYPSPKKLEIIFGNFLTKKMTFRYWVFSQIFFELEKKIGVEKKFGYSFDVKFSDLSIYDVFRAFGVRQIWFPAPTRQNYQICRIGITFPWYLAP